MKMSKTLKLVIEDTTSLIKYLEPYEIILLAKGFLLIGLINDLQNKIKFNKKLEGQ